MSLDAHYVALSLLPHIGGKTFRSLLDHFGSPQAALEADLDSLRAVHGVGEKIARSICAVDVAQVQSEMMRWNAQGIEMHSVDDVAYPALLQDVEDAPPVLFTTGRYDLVGWDKLVAIVGTRSPSADAARMAFLLAQMLSGQGWGIVSGMALGIDTAAHRGALSVEQGRTVAVLGGGVLNIYPPQNRELVQSIQQSGVLLSENHPEAASKTPGLVARNRIITGLARHVIIVETAVKGGAMYAARAAQAQGRTVHVMGFPASGNLELLKGNVRYLDPGLTTVDLE